MNPQNYLYYQFASHVEYKHMQCGIRRKGMKTYQNNVLKEENTTMCVHSIKHGDGVNLLVARMQHNQAPRDRELHTPNHTRLNANHEHHIKHCRQDIITSI